MPRADFPNASPYQQGQMAALVTPIGERPNYPDYLDPMDDYSFGRGFAEERADFVIMRGYAMKRTNS